jgi:hypothetical protein
MSGVRPPSKIWGLHVTPRAQTAPTEIESLAVRLGSGSIARFRLLQWRLEEFAGDPAVSPLNSGWLLTLAVHVGDAATGVHLWQGDGSFWTVEGISVSVTDASEVKAVERPVWRHRSQRCWPVGPNGPLPFAGQFRTREFFGYVFGSFEDDTAAVHLVRRSEQDAEDHYDGEAD